MGSSESNLHEHKYLLEYGIELKKRQVEVLEKEIRDMQKELTEVKNYLEERLCKECKKTSPPNKRVVMGSGEIYCLDCGYQVLDLLKARNEDVENRRIRREEQSYREFYEEVKAKQNATL